MSGDLNDIAKQLFTSNLQPENSIDMQFDESDIEYIFQVIVNIYLEGLKIKKYAYYENNELKIDLSDENIRTMSYFIKSIKFRPTVEILDFEKCETRLQDRYCNIVPNVDGTFQFKINPMFYQKVIDQQRLSDYTAMIINDKRLIILSFDWNN